MALVNKEFTYYDDGCFPTVHAVGETVTGEVEDFAISQGFAGAESASGVYIAKHRGGGKWDVHGPDGVVVPDLDKDTAKATAESMNEVPA
jgi:hypothetical protein